MPACSSSCRARSRRPSPHPVGAALHRRGRGRLHRRRRRAHDHARGRLRDHADLDVARPRQRFVEADGVARRARYPAGGDVQRGLRRERRRGRAGGDRARGHVGREVRQRPAAGRLEAGAADLADLQLSLFAHARGAGRSRQGRPARRLPRLQAALRQSGERRRADRHHGHLHAAPAQGLRDRALPQHRRHGVLGGRGRGRDASSATRCCAGRSATTSWCRAGPRSCTRPRARRCCSPSPTVRSRRGSICGARIAAANRAQPSSQPACFT